MSKNIQNKVIFSFAESDQELKNQISKLPISKNLRVENRFFSDLKRFKIELANHAGRFLGNDSGPSHMAAMLGIPTEVCYQVTNPALWRPLGPRVKVYDLQSDADNIL